MKKASYYYALLVVLMGFHAKSRSLDHEKIIHVEYKMNVETDGQTEHNHGAPMAM